MTRVQEILLLGLPASGKTTYLAALWYLLQQEDVEKKMALARWPDTRDYLNKLSQKWTRFQPVARNLLSEDVKKIQLSLKNDSNNVDLHIPDSSGEFWRSLWATRNSSREFSNLVKDAGAILLFIHAENITHPIDIMTIRRQVSGNEPTESAEPSETSPWNPENSPTQVILVDLLQCLACSTDMGRERPVAIIVSAWDKVSEMGQTPVDFLATTLPLLDQFLKNSGLYASVKVYGVSAQGGDLEVEKDLKRLQQQDQPAHRVIVDDGQSRSYDLTLPLHWLIFGDTENG